MGTMEETLSAIVQGAVARALQEIQPANGNTTDDGDEFLSPQRAAAFAQVNVRTVRNWYTRDGLKHVRRGRLVRIRRRDLEAFLNASPYAGEESFDADAVALKLVARK